MKSPVCLYLSEEEEEEEEFIRILSRDLSGDVSLGVLLKSSESTGHRGSRTCRVWIPVKENSAHGRSCWQK